MVLRIHPPIDPPDEQSDRERYIEREMDYYYQQGVTRFEWMVKSRAESFAKSIAWGADNGDKDAELIWSETGLIDLHLFALVDDEERFEKELMEE